MSKEVSGLAFINVTDPNPFELFKKWEEEVANAGLTFFRRNAMCLATCTKEGKVSNRNVLMKGYNGNGFHFITTSEGRKYQDIQENPEVAATFLWTYTECGNDIVRQVRIEGNTVALSREECQQFFDQEAFYCKVRAHLCHQGQAVDWKSLKENHDEIVKNVTDGKIELEMPDTYVGFVIVPERMDFYYAYDNHIGDRVVFEKQGNEWNFHHVAA